MSLREKLFYKYTNVKYTNYKYTNCTHGSMIEISMSLGILRDLGLFKWRVWYLSIYVSNYVSIYLSITIN